MIRPAAAWNCFNTKDSSCWRFFYARQIEAAPLDLSSLGAIIQSTRTQQRQWKGKLNDIMGKKYNLWPRAHADKMNSLFSFGMNLEINQ
jgi:hypothetical protein